MARLERSGVDDVAVVTVSYDSGDVLPDFLASIPGASAHPLLVVVADNLPDVGEVREMIEAAHAGYLALPGNRGYGGAINAAVATLPPTVSWILVSNPDVVLGEGAVDALRATAEEDPAIGAVGPAILTPDGTLYPSARSVPSIRIGVGHALFGNVWKTNPWSRRYHQSTASGARNAGWLSGACLLVRREAFDSIGGFDESYFMYFEDVDLGMRLGRAGYVNRYEPSARVVHTGAHSTASRNDEMIRAHHRSAARFLESRYPHPWQAPIRGALRLGLELRSRFVRARARSVDSTGPHTH